MGSGTSISDDSKARCKKIIDQMDSLVHGQIVKPA